jgi:AraC-like DNA-binding protein
VAGELLRRRAGAAVRPHVDGYWGYRERTGRPTRQREPLSTNAVLIFGLGSELRVDGRRFSTFVGGLDDSCPIIEHDGELRGIQVDLTPLGARMIFGVPMHELARQVVPLDELAGADAHRLEEQLDDPQSWDDRFAIVERFLRRRLAAAPDPPPDVAWAWRRLQACRGRVAIGDLARELGCSRKHLASRFRDHVGLPPKLVARTIRFRCALDALSAPSELGLDEVAFACGYYDQSHLDRDFREFASTTPSAYRSDPRTPVTFVQDD